MKDPAKRISEFKDSIFGVISTLVREHATVPPSAFYLKSTEGERHLRFCFAKKEETLKQAAMNLKGL